MKKYIGLFLATLLAFGVVGCTKEEKGTGTTTEGSTAILQAEMPQAGEEIAVVTTSKGTVKIRLYPEEAPKAVENFKALAESGYYDGIIFHRVIDNFMIQGGDPTGTGTGGESTWGSEFEDEMSPDLHFYRGALAMANRGPNTNGSQFFIVQNKKANAEALKVIRETRDENDELGLSVGETFYTIKEIFTDEVLKYYEDNGGSVELEYVFGNPYTIFGQVFEGLDVVDQIAAVEVNGEDKPLEDVVIEKVEFVGYDPSGNKE